MADLPNRTNAEVLDILFAVAIGEGFISGLYGLKDEILSGAVLTLGDAGQSLYRALLGFLIIILSWLHYRASTLTGRRYPAGEFVFDIIVIVSYMTLFLFVDAPVAFYTTIAVIWLAYVLARADYWRRNAKYLVFCVSFVGFFVMVAVSTRIFTGLGPEWARLMLVTIGVALYRPFDRTFMEHS